MSKKKHDPVKSLKAAFKEAVEDGELRSNYDRFNSNLEYAKEKHNNLVPVINENLAAIRTLKESILELALRGILAEDAALKVKDLETLNKDLIERIEEYKTEMEENRALIEKYDSLTEHKLFVWWKALTAVDPETEPWLDWKEIYKDKII